MTVTTFALPLPRVAGDLDVVCVLHGNPTPAPWLHETGDAMRLHLVLNDPGAGKYTDLPLAAVHCNPNVRGFAANVNAAVTRAFAANPYADRVVILNFDLDVAEGAFERLAATLDDYPEAGIVGAALLSPSGEATHSVGRQPSLLGEATRALGLRSGVMQQVMRAVLRHCTSWGARNTVQADVAGASGDRSKTLQDGQYLPWACVAVRRSAWEQVGGLDERFFMYCEDVDWGRRASAAGFTSVLVDVGPVIHSERVPASPATNMMFEQSHIALHRKWEQPLLAQAVRIGLTVRRFSPLRWMSAPLDWKRLSHAA